MKEEQKQRLFRSFLIGFVAAAAIVAAFVIPAKVAGLEFVMGFPLFLVSHETFSHGTKVTISWLIPVVVGIFFVVIDALRMV